MYEFTHRLPHEPFRPGSRNEDEYFTRLEIERRRERARKRRAELDRKEKERLRALHQDHCPQCGTTLERVRVAEGEVRECPECRGVFMEHEMFARLTHPESEERSYLADLFSGLLLDFTLGNVPDGAVAPEGPDEGT